MWTRCKPPPLPRVVTGPETIHFLPFTSGVSCLASVDYSAFSLHAPPLRWLTSLSVTTSKWSRSPGSTVAAGLPPASSVLTHSVFGRWPWESDRYSVLHSRPANRVFRRILKPFSQGSVVWTCLGKLFIATHETSVYDLTSDRNQSEPVSVVDEVFTPLLLMDSSTLIITAVFFQLLSRDDSIVNFRLWTVDWTKKQRDPVIFYRLILMF